MILTFETSIKRKVTTVIMRASIAVLLVTVAAFMTYDLVTFRRTMVQNLVTEARTIAENSTAALAFGNESDAANVLSSLQSSTHITAAALYDAQGRLFAKYPVTISQASLPASPRGQSYQFGKSYLILFQPVVRSGKPLGTIYLQSDLTALSQRLQLYGAFSLMITAGSITIAFWLSTILQRRITDPVIVLAKTAQIISREHNYSLRAPKVSDDELGLLTDAFNEMLERIQTSDSALRASEAQFRFVTDQAPVLLAHMNRDYRYLFVNRSYAARYNQKPEDIVGKHAIEVVGVELFKRARPYADKALAGHLVQFELEIPGSNHEPRWSHAVYTPQKTSGGEVVSFVAVHTDITERRRTEQMVMEKEQRLRAIYDGTHEYIGLLLPDGTLIETNRASLNFANIKREEVIGKPFWETDWFRSPPGTPTVVQNAITRAAAGEFVRFEAPLVTPAGGTRYFDISFYPILDLNRKVIFIVPEGRDVTDMKLGEKAVRESERRERERAQELAVLIEAVPLPVIIVHDAEGRHMTGNHAAAELLRIPPGGEISVSAPGNLKPTHFKSFKDGRELQPSELPAQRAAHGELVNDFEFELLFDDGTLLNLLGSGTPLLDERGHPRGAVHTLVNITERKRAEEQLREAKEAAESASRSKDDFLAALSHELRTPLNPVLLIASEAEEDAQLPAEVRAQFAAIRNNVELEARLIDDLLDLTRITRGMLSIDLQSLDAHEVLQEAIRTVRADAAQKQISMVIDFRAKDHFVSGDSVRLQQLFWNVLKNAVKFTPAAGKITLLTFSENGSIFIEIIDNGIGINPGELKRIFDAFAQGDHATRGSHRFGGLGLGLAISQKLAELHSGSIQAASEGRDKGAKFTIKLPLCTPAEQKNDGTSSTSSNPTMTPARTNSILLVEDHEPTRTALAKLLKRRQFKVLVAASLAEGRELAGKNKIDLLISDIGLPDGSGFTLMRELREVYGVRGIALTGYGMENDISHSQKAGFIVHLTKPVRIQSLDGALKKVLDQLT